VVRSLLENSSIVAQPSAVVSRMKTSALNRAREQADVDLAQAVSLLSRDSSRPRFPFRFGATAGVSKQTRQQADTATFQNLCRSGFAGLGSPCGRR